MNSNWLNYHHLYYFFMIAKTGSISSASKVLRIGQPALSTQLKGLESALGVILFERGRNGFTLTDEGKLAYQYAERLFQLGEEFVSAISEKKRSAKSVRLGALDGISKHIIARVVEGLSGVSTGNISVFEGDGNLLLQDLKDFKLDLVVSNYPPPVGDHQFLAKKIAKLNVGVLGSSKFKSKRKGFPRSLNGQPFIFSTNHSKLRQDLDHFFSNNRIVVNPVIESQDTALQKILAMEGKGLVALPLFAVQEYIDENKLTLIGKLELVEEVWIISAKRNISDGVFQGVVQNFKFLE